jgi:phosphoglycolate phosphatase
MSFETPRAVIWDLDGTLIDSARDLAASLNELLNQHGLRGHRVRRVRPMIGCGVSRLVQRAFTASGVHLEGEDLDRVVRRFLRIYRTSCTRETELRPRTREALLQLYNSGVRQGVCTNKPEDITRLILADLDITGFFESVVGGDTTPYRKPRPESLLHCIDALGETPRNALMIGDSATDVEAARAAGVPILVVPGGYSEDPPESLGADGVVHDLEDLARRLTANRHELETA